MARRRFRRFRRRRFRRRRSRASKALSIARSLSRKVAAEVKKADAVALLTPASYRFILGDTDSAASSIYTLRDIAHLYPVFGSGDVQGIQLDDFIGEQVRAKYLYIGLHLQLPVSQLTSATTNPVTMRVMVIQDRNFESGQMDALTMFRAIFGVSTNFILQQADNYAIAADSTLLPINPQQPGRFKVLRDFQMNVAPGWRQDYYKKLYIRQRELLSKGRIYYGDDQGATAGQARPPGDVTSIKSVARNALYVFTMLQSPVDQDEAGSTLAVNFNLTIQTRFAFYDN